MRSNSPSVNPDRVNEDEPHLELSSNSYSPTYNRVLMVTSPILYFLHVFMSPLYSFFLSIPKSIKPKLKRLLPGSKLQICLREI